MTTLRLLAAATVLSVLSMALAQTGVSPTPSPPLPPTPERFAVWGGLSSEFLILPGVNVSVSSPVATNLTLRGTVGVTAVPLAGDSADGGGFGFLLPVASANVDLLFGRTTPGTRLYGGPSVGLIFGPSFLAGGVAGVRGEFAGGPWGYYAEAKLRGLFAPGMFVTSPGLNLGITYRF